MKTDAFSKYHPAVNFIFFAGAVICTVLIQHPAYLAVNAAASGLYFLILKGRDGWYRILTLLPLCIVLTLINPLFNIYGATVLFTVFNRPYTLEALFYGAAIASIFGEMVLWFGCSHEVLTSDKLTSLFGNLIPVLSLLLVMILRMIPGFMGKARQITEARAAIGHGVSRQSAFGEKLREGLKVLGALTSWALEGGILTADSMKSRGYGSGRHTSFRLYKMKKSDGMLMTAEVLFLVLMVILGDRTASFTPLFYIAPLRGRKLLGLIFYTLYLLIPSILALKEAVQWHISISKI